MQWLLVWWPTQHYETLPTYSPVTKLMMRSETASTTWNFTTILDPTLSVWWPFFRSAVYTARSETFLNWINILWSIGGGVAFWWANEFNGVASVGAINAPREVKRRPLSKDSKERADAVLQSDCVWLGFQRFSSVRHAGYFWLNQRFPSVSDKYWDAWQIILLVHFPMVFYKPCQMWVPNFWTVLNSFWICCREWEDVR